VHGQRCERSTRKSPKPWAVVDRTRLQLSGVDLDEMTPQAFVAARGDHQANISNDPRSIPSCAFCSCTLISPPNTATSQRLWPRIHKTKSSTGRSQKQGNIVGVRKVLFEPHRKVRKESHCSAGSNSPATMCASACSANPFTSVISSNRGARSLANYR